MADTMGQVQMASFIPEIVAGVALGKLRNASVLLPTVTTNTALTPEKVGNKILVPKRGTVTANDKAAGTAVTLQNPTASQVEVTLNKHKEVTFLLEDVAAAMQNQDTLLGYVEDGVVAIAEALDDDLLALYSGLSSSVGVAGTDVDADLIVDARKTLSDNKAPLSDRFLILSPKDVAAILKIEKFTSSQWVDDMGQAMKEAFIGRRYGFTILEHQGVKTSGSSPTSTHNMGYQRGAFVVATRPLPLPPSDMGVRAAYVTDAASGLTVRVVYSWNADYLGVQVTIDVLYGVAELRDELAVEVLA